MPWYPPRTWAVGEAVTAQRVNEQLRDNMLALTPVVGEYRFFARPATAKGTETVIGLNFLECNGTTVSRSNYSSLYNLFNTMTAPRGVGTTTVKTAMDAIQTTMEVTTYPDLWPGDQTSGHKQWWYRDYPITDFGFEILVDQEKILVLSTTLPQAPSNPAVTLTVIRGREGTVAASHNANATVSLVPELPFGSGDGATTFPVPDLRGRTLWSAAAAGHEDVLTIGRDDRAALSARRPKHRHETLSVFAGSTGNQVIGAWGSMGTGSPSWEMHGGLSQNGNYGVFVGPLDETGPFQNFAANTTPVDAPGYVIGGVWGIRFVGV